MTFHPGAERLLAGLVNIIPELAELGKAQALVGDPPRTVIDHEDKSAGQQQESHKSEKSADHASPYIYGSRKRHQPIPGQFGKFNLINTLLAFSGGGRVPADAGKTLTLQKGPFIRSPNGGGRNPAAAVL
jgi:hypothetical protein